MPSNHVKPFLALAAILLAAGCTGGETGGGPGGNGGGAGSGGAPPGGPPEVVYHRDIKPLLTKNCAGCHYQGGIGPFVFDSYTTAAPLSDALATVTTQGRMPPWMPSADCAELTGVRGLSPTEIALIARWNELGAPEGDPADTPVAPAVGDPSADLQALITPAVTLDPGGDYVPNPALTDDHHCFVLDPQLAAEQSMIGFELRPGDKRVVHHAILYMVAEKDAAAVQILDEAEPGIGYTCRGGIGVTTRFLAGWVPGTSKTAFPAGTAMPLPVGTKLVMQIHYNTLTTKQGRDRTTADLYFAPPGSALTKAFILPLANSSFNVPPGAKDMTFSKDIAVPFRGKLWGAAPHMHVYGTRLSVEIIAADGARTCVIDVPGWDFNWQQMYFLKNPIDLQLGSTIKLHCTYDNSAEHQPIIDGKRQIPGTLQWGEKTTDEMCLNYIYVTGR